MPRGPEPQWGVGPGPAAIGGSEPGERQLPADCDHSRGLNFAALRARVRPPHDAWASSPPAIDAAVVLPDVALVQATFRFLRHAATSLRDLSQTLVARGQSAFQYNASTRARGLSKRSNGIVRPNCPEAIGNVPLDRGFVDHLRLGVAAISLGEWKLPELPKWPVARPFPNSPLWVVLSPPGAPVDKRRLMTVQDFFRYTELEGRRFFDELDADGDRRITVGDLKAALRARNLPEHYANHFVASARGSRWWAHSIGWDEFQALMDEKEPKMLRAFTSMEVNPAGKLEISGIKGTLTKLGLTASDENAKAMINALGAGEDGVVDYGRFRNFLVLLPPAKLTEMDPSLCWFEAATVVPYVPPAHPPRSRQVLVRAALAGGIASGSTTLMMYPLDTLKTRVQSAVGASIADVVRTVPQIGLRGLYRGVIPATSGQFVSHGLRTFSYEGSLQLLKTVAGAAPELQLQGLASGMGTVLGTCVRIPCEVLKQRLQVGRHDNCLEALAVARKSGGVGGLFRGTAALLSREVPFYVFGMMGYAQLKKAFSGSMFGGSERYLADWQLLAIGGLAGALASVTTTPADVLKTRLMSAAADQSVNAGTILADILRNEGVGALFKGALPRAVWVMPLGAMNFAGYELAKKALSQKAQVEMPQKSMVQAACNEAASS